MTGLTAPPKAQRTSSVFLRLLVLMVLVLAAGVLIWAAVTNQRIQLTETGDLADIVPEEEQYLIDGHVVNVEFEPTGRTPVVFLHDADIAGSTLWGGVTGALPESFRAVQVDLPGFGLSDRITTEGPRHTVASMAEVVATLIDDRLLTSPIVVGVGLGGKVGAELAVTHPELVRGLVLVDVDFWESGGWEEFAEKLPFLGPATTYTFSTGGLLGSDRWAPNCEVGGWCPTSEQTRAREAAVNIRGTTDSFRSFLRTLPSSLVPSDLGEIAAPTVFIWSHDGQVPGDSIELFKERMPSVEVVEVAVWKTHLEQPTVVVDAITNIDG